MSPRRLDRAEIRRRLGLHGFADWALDGLMDAFEYAALVRIGKSARRRRKNRGEPPSGASRRRSAARFDPVDQEDEP